MEPEFWHKKWENREIGFHEGKPNSLLVEHFSRLNLSSGGRVFLPLCGKTRDIAWLRSQGYAVAGAELNESAIGELFQELEVEPEITTLQQMKHYSGPGLDFFVGNIFHLAPDQLGPVQAVYDRAAMVALPEETRRKYTAHLVEISDEASQLLITFQYDQNQMEGPPFSISSQEIESHYGHVYEIQTLESRSVEGNLKGKVEATETIRLLSTI